MAIGRRRAQIEEQNLTVRRQFGNVSNILYGSDTCWNKPSFLKERPTDFFNRSKFD